jgi:hypothetical protein
MKLRITQPLSQRDYRWKDILLGFNINTYTIGSDGCLLTTLCHYLNSCGIDILPDQLNEEFKELNLFVIEKDYKGKIVGTGLFKWGNFHSKYLLESSPRYIGMDTPVSFFNAIEGHLEACRYVILEIDSSQTIPGQQMHFVGLYGYTDDKTDYYIADPLDGKLKMLSTYGDKVKITYSYHIYDGKLEKVEVLTTTTTSSSTSSSTSSTTTTQSTTTQVESNSSQTDNNKPHKPEEISLIKTLIKWITYLIDKLFSKK